MTKTAEQQTLPESVLLSLLPGALATIVFVLLVDPVVAFGFPPIAAFLLAIALVILPFELGLLLWLGRQRNGRLSLEGVVLYREPMKVRDWAWLYPLLLLAAFLGFGVLAVVEPGIRSALFGWLPSWFLTLIDFDAIGAYSANAWVITLAAYFALNVVAGPITEELYFRGYLLPRIDRFGRWAPLINVTLFSIYHFWSPWQILARIVGVGPFVYAVWWKRNIYLGMAVHVSLNLIATAIVAVSVMGRL
jgi:membrane protease YdiL (CAAX protease family)